MNWQGWSSGSWGSSWGPQSAVDPLAGPVGALLPIGRPWPDLPPYDVPPQVLRGVENEEAVLIHLL